MIKALTFDKYFYSRSGSHIFLDKWGDGFKVSSVRNAVHGENDMFTVTFEETPKISFLPWEFTAETGKTKLSVCLFGRDSLYIKGKGDGIELKYFDYSDRYVANYFYYREEKLFVCDYKNMSHQCYSPVKGSLEIDFPSRKGAVCSDSVSVKILPDENGEFEVALEQFYTASRVPVYTDYPYAECVKCARSDFEAWAERFSCKTQADYEAAFAFWENTVSPCGYITEKAVVMSKSGMSGIWSWDNVINAMGIAKYDFDLAYYEFMLPYLYMDEYGCAPDCVRDGYIDMGYVKPPIQGFCYPYLIKLNSRFGKIETLKKVYPAMKKNTDWWLNLRGETPFYQHGNDSGADNSTCFDACECIESPDLPALLSVQCDFLSEIAEKLGYCTDKCTYKRLADELTEKAVTRYWDGELFVLDANTGEKYRTSSLLPLRMLVLGKHLPEKIRAYISERLKNHHYSEYGLSSEALDSPLYEEDGYWRGPAWAPDQVIMTLALKSIGEEEFADRIAENYAKTIEDVGFFENISTVQKRGLRAKCYTWTAAAYLILRNGI